MIKDSGNRTKFESGAVRDIQEGKGRCDLLPLDIIDQWCDDGLQCTLYYLDEYLNSKCYKDFFGLILDHFATEHQAKRIASGEDDKMIPLDQYKWNLVLEVAKHFEEGAKKYGDRNWEKGIPCYRYIDSAVRHYCKWRAGWTDEPHDRAFIWNILCCEWTRQRYGWNLERLETAKKYENIFGMKTELLDYNWQDTPGCDFKMEGGRRNGKDFLTQCLNRYYSHPQLMSGSLASVASNFNNKKRFTRSACLYLYDRYGQPAGRVWILNAYKSANLYATIRNVWKRSDDVTLKILEAELAKYEWKPGVDFVVEAFDDESKSKEGIKIGEQFSKGIQDGIKQASSLYSEEAAEKVRWGCSQLTQTETLSEQCGVYDNIRFNDDTELTMSVEGDFSELFKMLVNDESNIKEVLENVKKSLGCRKLRRENFEKCFDTSCSECEYNAEPFSDTDALQTLIDYIEKSLKVAERRNPYVKDTDEGWQFYDADGRLAGYIFNFEEPEEQKKHQLRTMIHKVWHEATSNPYTIKRIVEEWGYICGKDFSICIAPDIAVKEYELRNRKYNEED